MEQSDTISSPDLATLEAEALAWTYRPGFDRAMRAFCMGVSGFYSRTRFARASSGATLDWAVCVLIIVLDQSRAEGVTFMEILNLCEAGGLGGRKAVRGALNSLLSSELVVEEAKPSDRRAKLLRPTEALFALKHDWLVARLSAMEFVQPLPCPAAEFGRRRRTLLDFLGGNVRAFARARFRLYDGFPEVRAFMDRASGYVILLDLLGRMRVDEAGAAASEASPSDLSARYKVSRAHVRKLLQAAHAQGWIGRIGDDRRRIEFSAAFHRRMRHWIGLEFVWMWRLVRDSA